jgi:membrane-associated protease RseP (regulator of RpoE activity)
MPGWLGIIAFALIIFVSVCLHEAGHMGTAKAFGMKVTRYFAGFGPTIWSFRKGETEYGLKAIPLGGFVKIVGMTPQDDDVEPGDEKRAMWRFPVWKRTIVMSAGSVTHFIIGLVLLWITVSFVGMPNPKLTTDQVPAQITLQNGVPMSATATSCSLGNGGCLSSPAMVAGLKDGDIVTAFNGTPTPHYSDLQSAIRDAKPGATVPVNVTRGGVAQAPVQVKLANVSRTPLDDPSGKAAPTAALGVAIDFDEITKTIPTYVKYGAIDGIPQTFKETGNMAGQLGSSIAGIPGKVPGLFKALSGQPRDPNGPISVVGAADIGGQIASHGLWSLFLLLAVTLNFFIGVFNLLPLLPLDGGHIAIAWFEKLRSWLAARFHRPDPGRVNYEKLMPATYAVILIFGGFSVLTILADIVNPINIFGK